MPGRAWTWLVLSVAIAGCGHSPVPAPIRDANQGPAPRKQTLAPTPAGFYRVMAGDTLIGIALDKGLDYRALADWNGLASPDRILAGQLLRLTPPAPSPAPGPTTGARVQGALKAAPTNPLPETSGFEWVWPAQGPLLSQFGVGASKGLDIAGEKGQRVKAAAQGRIVYVGSGLRGYGKLIIIRHGKTLLSAYAHHARILVQEGQDVVQGQVIGEMGDTDTDRIKLHFEIRESGRPVDPRQYLPPMS